MRLTRRRGDDAGDKAERDDLPASGAKRDAGRHVRSRGRAAPAAAEVEDEEGPPVPEYGPFDVSQAPRDEGDRFDLGALQLPAVAGVEIHLQAGQDGRIQQIQLAHGGSRLRISAYAAPRTEGIWDEIREELRASLAAGGAKPREIEGEYGIELAAKVTEGSTTTDVRHLGIDGPRWFVHALYLGSAAVDPQRAGPLREVLRGLVVDRGTEAMPVKEPLPLRLPAEAAAQLAAAAQERGESQAT